MLAYAYNEDGFSRVVVQDFVTRRALPQPRDLPRGVLTALDFSPDGRRLAIGITNATSAGDVWTFDLAGRGGTERWTQSELGDLDPARLAEPELWSASPASTASPSPPSSIARAMSRRMRGRR